MVAGKANHLIDETSPYLLQHAYNPVDWYPWGDEALRRARELDRPIFLSVGYSACHWCHVMERESFENTAIAALLNDNFISIKVDREERPDLDSIYMTAVQMMTGSGGWPMSVFLTPDLRPFYGGTYFPPVSTYGRPGFPDVLTQLAQHYRDNRGKVDAAASSLTDQLRQLEKHDASSCLPDDSSIEAAVRHAERSFDPEYGGFGAAPKFPRSIDLSLLLRWYDLKKVETTLGECEKTLECMARGGMYDQVGGGFHRYSVDNMWLVPHFEKMLYDNALLVRAYLEAFQVTGKELYRRVAIEVLDYVLREMTSDEGGFYSATDADSEGVEGKFFVWTPEQVREAFSGDDRLGDAAAAVFCAYYNITARGNFEHSTSIPNVTRSLEDFAADSGSPALEVKRIIARGRDTLYRVRAKRIPPLRDEKIITSWNGLMIAAFARGFQVLEDGRYGEAAAKAVAFIYDQLWVDGRLFRTHKDGRTRYKGYLEDYAYLAEALIDLYEATFELDYLKKARQLADSMIELFSDREVGGFFYTAEDHEELICRKKEYLDQATPAANGVAALTLLRLHGLTGKPAYREAAEEVLRSAGASVERAPMASSYLLLAVDFLLRPPVEIAIVGGGGASGAASTVELLRVVHRQFLPRKILAGSDAVIAPELAEAIPLLAGKESLEGRSTAFVCRNYACRAPTNDPVQLRRQLASDAR